MQQSTSIRETLRLILIEHGTGPCFSAVNCKMLLMESGIGHEPEIGLLTAAVDREIPAEMLRLHKSMPISVLLPKCTRWLARETDFDDAKAAWAVHSWAMALGLIPLVEESQGQVRKFN